MSMLAGTVGAVIGVDTHRDRHTVAVVDPTGAALTSTELPTDAFGYRRMLAFARDHAPGRRVWAIEGTGSFGAGLTTYLLEQQEWVVEIDRPARPARRNGSKTDELDAVRAAREALARDHLAQPRRRGDREAMRVLLTTRAGTVTARTKAICQLKALIVGAPEPVRNQLRRSTTNAQLDRCARLRTLPQHNIEHRCTVRALRTCARQALFLEAQASDLETELDELVTAAAPDCSPCPVSESSPPPRSSSAGPIPAGYATKPPSLHWPASRPSPRAAAKSSATASTAAETGNSTGHSTRSCCPDSRTTPQRRPTPAAAPPTASRRARSNAASSEPSPGRSIGYSNAPPPRRRPADPTPTPTPDPAPSTRTTGAATRWPRLPLQLDNPTP